MLCISFARKEWSEAKKGLTILKLKWLNFCSQINTDRNESIPSSSTSSLNSAGATEPVCEPQGKSIL